MRKITILMLATSLGATPGLAANAKDEHVGELICTVGNQLPKAGLLCVFRNKNTGLEETYQGDLTKAGGKSEAVPRTMLWRVNANSKIDLKPGILAQRYEPPLGEQQTTKYIEGNDKPGLSLSLITDRNDDLKALATSAMDLNLLSAPT